MAPIARVYKEKADIKSISKAIEIFENEKGSPPKELSELSPGYVELVPEDPWGKKYNYNANNERVSRVFSLGSDGKVGGEGSATDIYLNTDIAKVQESILDSWWGCN